MRPGMLHACFVRSPFAHATINGIDTSAALALPGVHAVFTAADINPDVKEAWHAVAGKDVPDTPRPPLAEGEVKFVGDPVALVIAESRYLAEDAVDLVDVDYDPLPADRRLPQGSAVPTPASRSCTRPTPTTSRAAWAGSRRTRKSSPRRPTSSQEHIYQQMYVPVPMETRGMVVEWASHHRGTHHLGVHPDAARTARVRARACSASPRRACASSCATPAAAFGQKVVPMREDMCILLAARKVSGRAEVDRGPPREPDVGRAVPPRRRHRPDGVRRRRQDPGRRHRLRPGRRGLPDAVPGADHRRHRHVLPRALPGAQGQLQLQDGVLQHPGPARLPRSVAVRNPHAGNASRHRSPQDGHGSRRAAAHQHPARRRDAVLQPQRHAI